MPVQDNPSVSFASYQSLPLKEKPWPLPRQLTKLEFGGEIEMDIHDLIVNELFDEKSLAALIFLIDCGRELEFKIKGKEYFISCDSSKKYVSLWENKNEQSFDSVLELIKNATIENMCFLTAWEQAELEYLY